MSQESSRLPTGNQSVLADIERAIYLTRAGKHEEARNIYQQHRSRSDFGEYADSSLMLMLLDGLISYYQDRDLHGAIDRLYRARALGLATRQDKVVSLICAWLSHCYLNTGQYELMFHALEEALRNGALDDAQTRARLLLTVADAHSLAGDFINGRPFYDSARTAAVSLGDTLSISAAAHNRSTLALSHVRFAVATDCITSTSAQPYLSELLSAANLESYLDQTSVLFPYQVWIARNDLLNGRYENALSAFESVLADRTERDSTLRTSVLADAAYCHYKLNDLNRAKDLLGICLAGPVDTLPSDDRAVAYGIAADIFGASADSKRRRESHDRLCLSRDAFIEEVESLNRQLAQFRSRSHT
jgi:tetratricopeptide (TPR) repeat protein